MIIGLSISVLLFLVCWFLFRIPRPEIPPLDIDENDPLMIDAIIKAKNSTEEFKELFNKGAKMANVKIPFKSSSGQIEFIWAEVKSITDLEMEVFLMTPPVTHTGQVERNQKYPIDYLVDWSIEQNNEKIKGGFTMKAMYQIAKERWGELPEKLKNELAKYE